MSQHQHHDAALKHTLEQYLGDWARFLGAPADAAVETIDADRSTISPRLDKLIRVAEANPWLMIVEPLSYGDPKLDTRMMYYEAVAWHQLGLEAHVFVICLFPRAWRSDYRGGVWSAVTRGRSRIDFSYELVRVWELPVESVLRAGVGLLPLAPLADVQDDQLPRVIDTMARRLDDEVSPVEAAELLTAAHILMGVRYGKETTNVLMRTVRDKMRDSPTYLEILEEGVEKGIVRGRAEGELIAMRTAILQMGRKRFGKPPRKSHRLAIEAVQSHDVLDSLLLRLLDVATWDELVRAIPDAS